MGKASVSALMVCLAAHIHDQRRIGDVRNEKGINNIVKRLPQHGDHHWRTHVEQQALDQYFCHFISALRIHI